VQGLPQMKESVYLRFPGLAKGRKEEQLSLGGSIFSSLEEENFLIPHFHALFARREGDLAERNTFSLSFLSLFLQLKVGRRRRMTNLFSAKGRGGREGPSLGPLAFIMGVEKAPVSIFQFLRSDLLRGALYTALKCNCKRLLWAEGRTF